MDSLRVVAEIAFRNLFASKWKTLIVGGIIGFGAFLVVVGTSLLDGVDRSMRRSITGSIAGHIQVYSSLSKDELEIMGGFGGGDPNLEPLPDFAAVRRTLLAVPNVHAVVPMGVSNALVSSGNTVDQALANLRTTVNQRTAGDPSPTLLRRYESQKSHVHQIVSVLGHEMENSKQVSERSLTEDAEAIDHATAPEFWASFDKDPFDHLEYLENRISPLASDADLLQLRYVGTDPQAFANAFDRMQIIDGTAIPPGKRGFLFTKYVYEEQVKLKAARGLDKLKTALDERNFKIAKDPDLQRIVRENSTGVRELLLQLDGDKTESFRRKLQKFLGSSESDVGKLLAAFFHTDDANFHTRYAFFYAQLAPELELYRVKIGDTLTVKAFTKSGYVQSASLKVYGTYTFKGLEKSPQAGSINMIDLVSFRELYGFMTKEREQEIATMRAQSGAKEIDRASAEAELFGAKSDDSNDVNAARGESAPAAASGKDHVAAHGGAALAAASGGGPNQSDQSDNDALRGLKGTRTREEDASGALYDPKQLEEGVVLNAAVLVKDERKIAQTMLDIEAAGKRAALPLKALSWQQAAGIIGQFATLMRAVLYAAVLIIFVVALVVINNALVMATLERVREIGTLRAVGAQRRFILAMLILESIVIGCFSGVGGALLGAGVLLWLGKVGIPAATDVMTFFFSGPRLYPTVGPLELVFALVTVLVVTVISSIYPAWLAMRVSPREAMQSED